ncbi:hypothetical protein, partial [Accumulibacter sp.]|uniref:hypothetical protein n=1 Tax=Accumulibacter sp. TaxID=2053492 RepID=UPI0028790529
MASPYQRLAMRCSTRCPARASRSIGQTKASPSQKKALLLQGFFLALLAETKGFEPLMQVYARML